MSYTGVVDKSQQQRVYERLTARLQLGGAEQQNLILRVCDMVIRDKLVAPTAMRFAAAEQRLVIYYNDEPCFVHRHALGQLAAKVELPMTFVSKLHDRNPEPWRVALLAHNLQELYSRTAFSARGGSPRFLHRIVGNELRGFLSRRFNRHLASAPLLRAFLDTCRDLGAQPVEALITDVRLGLRCFLPYIFEPVPGQFVALGVDWSNSDFGAGKLSVSVCLWIANAGTSVVLDQAIARVHIGSVIEDADIEMSEDTYRKEAETQAMAITDTVRSQLAADNVDKVLAALAYAQGEDIPWYKLRGQLARFLSKKEIEEMKECLDAGVIDLPPVNRDEMGRPLANAFWAMAALAKMAERSDDPDRKIELQHAAGALVLLPTNQPAEATYGS